MEIIREIAMISAILPIIRTKTGGMNMATIMTSVIPMELLERIIIRCITRTSKATTRNENKL